MRKITLLLIGMGILLSSRLFAQHSYSGIFHKTSATHIYLYQIPWEELINRNDELVKDSFQLVDLEAVAVGGEVSFWGIWQKTTRKARIERASGWENIIKVKRRMEKEGYTLIDIEGYRGPSGADLFVGVWIPGGRAQKLWNLDSWEGLLKNTARQSQEYFQLVDVEAYIDEWGATNYLAVYHKLAPSERGHLVRADDAETFYRERTRRRKSGYTMVDFETFDQNGQTFLIGMYKKEAATEKDCNRLDWASFVTYQDQLDEQYRLVDLEVSTGDGRLMVPAYHTSRLEATPSLSQEVVSSMIRAAEDEHRQSAPCAAANGLVWLSGQGFDRLLDGDDDSALARKLAGGQYMKSLRPGGPGTYDVINGLLRYIEASDYKIEAFSYQDIHPIDADRLAVDTNRIRRLEGQANHTNLDLAKEGLVGNSLVLIEWGVYEPQPGDSLNQYYQKVRSLWGTVVGYGRNEHGNEVANSLIVHSPTHGADPLYLQVQELDRRILLDEQTRLIDPSAAESDFSVAAGQQRYLKNALQEEGDRFAVWERTLVIKVEAPASTKEKVEQD